MKTIKKSRISVAPIEKSLRVFQGILMSKNNAGIVAKPSMIHQPRTIFAAVMVTAAMINSMGAAHAAIVSPCAGVSLAPSVITDIVGAAVLPITNSLDSGLLFLLGPLGLNSNLTTTLGGIAGGAPINLNVLDTSGNLVSPADECQASSDSVTLNTPKGISIGGNQITGLGNGAVANAGEMNSIAFGNGSVTHAAASNAIALGPNAFIGNLGDNSIALGSGANSNALNAIALGPNVFIGSLGDNSVALGSGSSTNVANSVALGASSIASTGAQTNYAAFGLPTLQTSVGEVSIGSAGNARKLTNLAAGSAATDAVNVSQLQAIDDAVVKYDPFSLKMTVTLGGPLSLNGGTTGGTRITNLSKGAVSLNSTDAINGSQLFAMSNGAAANMDALGLSMATNLGGGATYNSSTYVVSAPSYNVYGSSQNNVGAAIDALQANAPLQYSNVNGVATPNTPSNHITLVGSTPGSPVTIHNVADGVAPHDAVNMGQLASVQNNMNNLDALAVKYDDPSKNTLTLLGTVSFDGGITGGTSISNLSQGDISASSTDAINGSQLYATHQMIATMAQGSQFFNAKSVHGGSSAIGDDSVAAGSRAVASGEGSVAMGDNSQATNTGAIAIGQNAAATGVNSIAIGAGALATGSVAVGDNSQAGNGGAAFGDDAVALTPQQGTALGNAANVTANRGVALGAGAQATRAGMDGATEKYSNVAVTSTEGAVSVGSAGNERQITNVAGGTADTDAVNVRQLDAAIAQSGMEINNRLNALQSDISSVKYDAHAGTASAMAMASMPQSVVPGKVMIAAGVANYQGQSAVSVGVSNFSENGRWAVNFNGSANTRGNAGAAVGVGFHW